ncbi:MAG: nucleotidyltransferase domain-containing protein [Comamonas sp.]
MTATKGVDALGYIRCVGQAPIQPPFEAVVDALRSAVRGPLADLADLVDSVYIYGSVARADAEPGRSDLDAVLLLVDAPSAHDLERIEAVRRALEQRHSEVTKVDFDLGSLGEVHAPDNLERWGFWLKHHCRCIAGPDRTQAFPLFRPSRAVARAVNGDFPEVLTEYARRIAGPADCAQVMPLMRQAARKAIRATNVLRPADSNHWPESLDDHLQQFAAAFPESIDMLCFFAAQQRQPQADAQDFSRRLLHFVAWMQERL